MGNFGTFEGVLLAIILLMSFKIFRQVIRRNNLGKMVYKIREDHDSIALMVLWIVIALIIILTTIAYRKSIAEDLSSFGIIALPLAALTFPFNGTLKGIFNKELREKGVINKGKYYYWKDLRGHKWDEDRLEICFTPNGKKEATVIWFIKDDDMESIKEILVEKNKMKK